MKSITTAATVSIALGLSAGVSLAASNAGQNANLSPITVEARHEVQKKEAGLSYTGIPIEQVSLSRQVGYGDLDLSTSQGKSRLEKRIKTVAHEACNQLKKLYPLDTWNTDNRTCVSNAVDQAMTQEKTVVAGNQAR